MSTAFTIRLPFSLGDEASSKFVPEDLKASDLLERYVEATMQMGQLIKAPHHGQIDTRVPTERPDRWVKSNPLRDEMVSLNLLREPFPVDITKRLREKPSPVASFYPLQEWDGYITSVSETSFTARLTDISRNKSADEEEVDIPLSELDEDTQAQLMVGRLIRWSIGYQRSRSGQKTRVSRIVLRRLPAWTRSDIEAAKREATAISRNLRWE